MQKTKAGLQVLTRPGGNKPGERSENENLYVERNPTPSNTYLSPLMRCRFLCELGPGEF